MYALENFKRQHLFKSTSLIFNHNFFIEPLKAGGQYKRCYFLNRDGYLTLLLNYAEGPERFIVGKYLMGMQNALLHFRNLELIEMNEIKQIHNKRCGKCNMNSHTDLKKEVKLLKKAVKKNSRKYNTLDRLFQELKVNKEKERQISRAK